MIKIVKKSITVLVLGILLLNYNVHAATPTVDQVVASFNNSPSVQESAQSGTTYSAAKNGTGIRITSTVSGGSPVNYDYSLSGNVLSTNITGDQSTIYNGLMTALILTDSVGKLHGYEYEETYPTLNSDQIKNYKIGEEGFEIKTVSENNYQVQIDISKKLPLLDFSDTYITTADLEDLKEYISGDGTAEKRVGNVWFNKNGSNGENVVLIAEKDNLTSNAYNSFLSILEVMFGSKDAANYFKSNYSSPFSADKEMPGIKVEVNPTKSEFEESLVPSDSGFKMIRISINKQDVTATLNGEKPQERQAQVETKVNVPDTAKNIFIYMMIAGVISIISGTLLIINVLKKNRKLSNV